MSWKRIAKQSGDDRHDYGISHRGNAHVRAILFPLAMTAARFNPVIAAFYQRLITTDGKTRMEALVAVMAKMLRIAYAILRSGKPFDAAHEAARRKQADGEQAALRVITIIARLLITICAGDWM